MHASSIRLLATFLTLILGALASLATSAQAPAPDRPASSSSTVRDHRTDRPSETGTVRDHRTDRPSETGTVRDHRTTVPNETVPVHPAAPEGAEPNSNQEPAESHSFWTTLPGILTGLAGVIGAIGALVVAFRNKGQ